MSRGRAIGIPFCSLFSVGRDVLLVILREIP